MSETSVAQGRRQECAERMARERRGIALFRERGEEIGHVRGRLWAVPSCSGEGIYLVDLRAEICGCPDFENRRENCKHIYAAAIASAKSASCAGCGKKVRQRELYQAGPDNLTFFEGDELCPSCAVAPERGYPLFSLGRVVVTPGALEVLEDTGTDALDLLRRHATGDWGEIPACDARENEKSVRNGWRVFSSYPVGEDREKVWVITEADRSSTCLLLPEEY